MACNYTEKFTRIIGIGCLLALAAAAQSAFATEAEAGASAYGSTRIQHSESETSGNARFSARASVTSNTTDGESSEDDTAGNAAEDAVVYTDESIDQIEGHTEATITGAVQTGEELAADVEDSAAELGESLSASLSGEVAASVDAAIRNDVRSTVQEEVVTDIVRSLPLPGHD